MKAGIFASARKASSGATSSFWGMGATPGAYWGNGTYNLGNLFRVNKVGNITALMYYQVSTNTGTATLRLYINGTTTAVRTVTVATTGVDGWVKVPITPYPVNPGTLLFSSRYVANGYWWLAAAVPDTTDSPTLDGALSLVANQTLFNTTYGNGRYYPGDAYPNQEYNRSNHYVDLELTWDGLPPVSITSTFQGSTFDPAGLTTYTFSARPIGTASATRRVVVAVSGRKSGSELSGVTIGGVTATIDAINGPVGTTNDVAICSAVVPTGTTADVVVTWTAVNDRCGIGVWSLTAGWPMGITAKPASGLSQNLTVPTLVGNVVIAVTCWLYSAHDAAWSVATDRYNEVVEATIRHSGADAVAVGSSTAVSVSFGSGSDNVSCSTVYG